MFICFKALRSIENLVLILSSITLNPTPMVTKELCCSVLCSIFCKFDCSDVLAPLFNSLRATLMYPPIAVSCNAVAPLYLAGL